jgi:hypothetical protein
MHAYLRQSEAPASAATANQAISIADGECAAESTVLPGHLCNVADLMTLAATYHTQALHHRLSGDSLKSCTHASKAQTCRWCRQVVHMYNGDQHASVVNAIYKRVTCAQAINIHAAC